MGCWKWFNGTLKEAGITVTDDNKEKIDQIIHKYIGEQASYGRCSTNWTKAHRQIQENPQMKKELITKLKTLT